MNAGTACVRCLWALHNQRLLVPGSFGRLCSWPVERGEPLPRRSRAPAMAFPPGRPYVRDSGRPVPEGAPPGSWAEREWRSTGGGDQALGCALPGLKGHQPSGLRGAPLPWPPRWPPTGAARVRVRVGFPQMPLQRRPCLRTRVRAPALTWPRRGSALCGTLSRLPAEKAPLRPPSCSLCLGPLSGVPRSPSSFRWRTRSSVLVSGHRGRIRTSLCPGTARPPVCLPRRLCRTRLRLARTPCPPALTLRRRWGVMLYTHGLFLNFPDFY